MSMFLRLLVCLCVLLGSVPAHAVEPFSIDLAEDHVDITTGFTGSSVVIFGAKHQRGDVVITVEGPKRDVTVWRKDNVLGAWVNRSSMTFKDVPLYYDYAVSGHDLSADIDARYGVDGIAFDAGGVTKDYDIYKKAFISERQDEAFYPKAPQNVEFVGDELFRARMFIPANVPQGTYSVVARLMQGDKVVSSMEKSFAVGQVGFNAGVYEFAQGRSFFYAMICVFIAVVSGWLSHKIARRS